MTQREEPRLALIETALLDGQLPGDETLRLRVPDGTELNVAPAASGREVEVTVWKDRCAAFDAGDRAAGFLTAYLGSPVRLVRFDARRKRPSNPDWTPGVEALNQFSDGFAVAAGFRGFLGGSQQPAAEQAPDESLPPEHRRQRLAAVRRRSAARSDGGQGPATPRERLHRVHRHDDRPGHRPARR
jgi:hypothetical protein